MEGGNLYCEGGEQQSVAMRNGEEEGKASIKRLCVGSVGSSTVGGGIAALRLSGTRGE